MRLLMPIVCCCGCCVFPVRGHLNCLLHAIRLKLGNYIKLSHFFIIIEASWFYFKMTSPIRLPYYVCLNCTCLMHDGLQTHSPKLLPAYLCIAFEVDVFGWYIVILHDLPNCIKVYRATPLFSLELSWHSGKWIFISVLKFFENSPREDHIHLDANWYGFAE